MKSLFSKAAGRIHRCGCRSCSTLINGAGQRVTAAPRRKATFAEIFTACYSSVLASAAIVDATWKEERRQDLERQLEEARAELAEVQRPIIKQKTTTKGAVFKQKKSKQRHGDIKSELALLSEDQMEELWDSMKAIWFSRPHNLRRPAGATPDFSELCEKLQKDHFNVRTSSRKAKRQAIGEDVLLSKAILLEETEPAILRRPPRDHTHLRSFSKHILAMVELIMEETKGPSKQRYQGHAPSMKDAQELIRQGFPRYTLPAVDPEAAQKNMVSLNEAIRSIMADSRMPYVERIGRICYNLLMSAYPPDIHTFNTLIQAFRPLPFVGAHVVDAFWHRSFFIPTPATYTTILRHEIKRDNYPEFWLTIGRMVGEDGKLGAKVRRWHIDDVTADGRIPSWLLHTSKRTLCGDWVSEHAPLNKLAVEEILHGLVHFREFEAAMSLFTSCIQAGVHLTNQTLVKVIDECLLSLNWSAGVQLIQSLTQNGEMWSSMLQTRHESRTSYILDRISAILDMIGLNMSNGSISVTRLEGLGISMTELTDLDNKMKSTNAKLPKHFRIDLGRRGKAVKGAKALYQKGDTICTASEWQAASRLLQLESIEMECKSLKGKTQALALRLAYPIEASLDMNVSTDSVVAEHLMERQQEPAAEVSQVTESFPSKPVIVTQKLSRRDEGSRVLEVEEYLAEKVPPFESREEIAGRREASGAALPTARSLCFPTTTIRPSLPAEASRAFMSLSY